MHRLAAGVISIDASVAVDFHLVGKLPMIEDLFTDRLLMSDFVEIELLDADIRIATAAIISLSTDEEWNFFDDVRRRRPGLGLGELGALTVAHFRGAIMVTNDRQARNTAEESNVPVSGGLGVLEYAAEAGRLSGPEAVTVLEEMIQQGAWISDELLELFRQRVLGSH